MATRHKTPTREGLVAPNVDLGLVKYNIHELFYSVQGEGQHAGHTAFFVRLQGCPVGCSWCDAKRTWAGRGGNKLTLHEIKAAIDAAPSTALIIVTGGEPLIYDLDPLFSWLFVNYPERFIHLETSGAYAFKGKLRPSWVTLSPKAAADWLVADNVMARANELKYVVDADFDPNIIEAHGAQLWRLTTTPVTVDQEEAPAWPRTTRRVPVYLMPEGAPPTYENVQRTLQILETRPRWRFGPRLQYDYLAIREREGDTNEKVAPEQAREELRARLLTQTAVGVE
jgi:7-carboxy-7-deazaguanine synthase